MEIGLFKKYKYSPGEGIMNYYLFYFYIRYIKQCKVFEVGIDMFPTKEKGKRKKPYNRFSWSLEFNWYKGLTIYKFTNIKL